MTGMRRTVWNHGESFVEGFLKARIFLNQVLKAALQLLRLDGGGSCSWKVNQGKADLAAVNAKENRKKDFH